MALVRSEGLKMRTFQYSIGVVGVILLLGGIYLSYSFFATNLGGAALVKLVKPVAYGLLFVIAITIYTTSKEANLSEFKLSVSLWMVLGMIFGSSASFFVAKMKLNILYG